MTEIGAAIVGCRAVAPLHAKALARAPGARLRVVRGDDPYRFGGLAYTYYPPAVVDAYIADVVGAMGFYRSLAGLARRAGAERREHQLKRQPPDDDELREWLEIFGEDAPQE